MKFFSSVNKSHSKITPSCKTSSVRWFTFLLLMALFVTGCASGQKGKVSGNFDNYSRDHVVAILPIETTGKGQGETADLFRRSLYANLTHANFKVMERYAVDALLKKEGLTDPADYLKISPMRLGEILGVDAVILSRVEKVQRLYLVLHASIEVAVSVQMVDTRSGEVLWHADQAETAFEGLAKVPTGFIAAGYGPLQFVTNKVNLFKVTKGIANGITALLKNPQQAKEEEKFDHQVIAVAALDDYDDIRGGQYAQENETKLVAFDQDAKEPLKQEIQVAKLDPVIEKKSSDGHHYPELEIDHSAGEIEETTFTEDHVFPELERDLDAEKKLNTPSESEVLSAKADSTYQEQEITVPDTHQDPEVELASFKPVELQPLPPVTKAEDNAANHESNDHEQIVQDIQRIKPASSFYSIQVGAFKAQSSAYKMISRLSSKGYSAFINTVEKDDGSSLYKVQLEKFEHKEAAVQFARDFKAQENIDNFITRVNS
jgi:cell division septation protein DedD